MTYGRADLAERVSRHEGSVLLLTGDSGVGKSAVLLLSTDDRAGWISPRPTSLARSAGSLHDGFLEQLGAALSVLVERGLGLPTLAERLTETGQRLLNERVSVLGRVALAEIVAVLRGRVGDDVGKAVERYAREIWPNTAETLAAKASRARDPLAYQVLVAFAAAAQELSDGMRLALTLDQGQRLSSDDLRVLADLAEPFPRGVHLRLAYATDTRKRTRAVAELRGECPTISEIEVPPLTQDVIEEWLVVEALEPTLAERLARQTGGYPLLVEAAIAHLKSGEELGDMPRHEQLARRTRVSFDQLTPKAAAAARSLAVLADPLPDVEMRELAGINDVGEWATVTSELEDARIFSVQVNGRSWFHAERRAFVLNECLTGEQRDEAATAAALLMWSRGLVMTDFSRVALFAAVVGLAPSYQAHEPHLATAITLDAAELAVASSLLELAVENRIVADADDVFSHALSFVAAVDDPESVLRRLVDAEFVVTATNDWATAIAASWAPRTQAVIQGRSGLQLRRTATPRLVEIMFGLVLRDQLGEFETAQFGIGGPSIGSLGRIAAGAEPRRGYIDRQERRLGTNLLLRGKMVDSIPFYCSAAFANARARDDALARLEGLSVAAAVGEVRLTQVVRHPLASVPTQRFVAALRRARRDSRVSIPDSGDFKLPPPEGMSDQEIASERVRAAEVIAELATQAERLAMELDDGYILLWDADDRYWEEAVVHGGGFEERYVPELSPVGFNDHYAGLRLRLTLGLSAGQAVVHRRAIHGENSRVDPLAAEISYRISRSRIFNSAQPPLHISLSKEHLQPVVAEAFAAEMRDARILAERFPRSIGKEPIEPRALWLLIVLDEPDPRWVAGARGSAIYAEGPSPAGRDVAEVELVQGNVDRGDYVYTVEHDLFERTFAAAGASARPRGISAIDSIIARILRYDSDDIRLVWPDDLADEP